MCFFQKIRNDSNFLEMREEKTVQFNRSVSLTKKNGGVYDTVMKLSLRRMSFLRTGKSISEEKDNVLFAILFIW